MRVLGLACSPRRGGNTDLLLDELLRGAREAGAETEKVDVCRLRITPCRNCGACEKTGQCRIRDEMQGLYRQIELADVVILASPIFFYGVTAQCKALIDRCQALWSRKYRLGKALPEKTGFFVSVGATRGRRLFEGAILTVKYFFYAINATYGGDLLFREVEARGEIRNHPTALQEAYEAGRRLVRTPPGSDGDEQILQA